MTSRGDDWSRERNDDVRFDLSDAHPLAIEARRFIRRVVTEQEGGAPAFAILEKEYGISFSHMVCVAANVERLRLAYIRRQKAKPYDAFNPNLWWYE